MGCRLRAHPVRRSAMRVHATRTRATRHRRRRRPGRCRGLAPRRPTFVPAAAEPGLPAGAGGTYRRRSATPCHRPLTVGAALMPGAPPGFECLDLPFSVQTTDPMLDALIADLYDACRSERPPRSSSRDRGAYGSPLRHSPRARPGETTTEPSMALATSSAADQPVRGAGLGAPARSSSMPPPPRSTSARSCSQPRPARGSRPSWPPSSQRVLVNLPTTSAAVDGARGSSSPTRSRSPSPSACGAVPAAAACRREGRYPYLRAEGSLRPAARRDRWGPEPAPG